MPKGAASECGGMGRTRERNPSRQAKAAKTGVLRRYIFYEMQADQGVKAIQFVKLRVLVVITNICNSNTIGKACAAPPPPDHRFRFAAGGHGARAPLCHPTA